MDLMKVFQNDAYQTSKSGEKITSPGPRPAAASTRILTPALSARAAALKSSGTVRHILYVPGPGDVAGTYRHWLAGRDDPSIPAIGYSHQVYELAQALGARLSVLSEEAPGVVPDGTVRFLLVPPSRGRGVGYHLNEIGYGLRLLAMARQQGADTILMQRMLTHFWPMALARLLGIRMVYSLHNTLWPAHRAPTRRERLIGWLNGWAFRRAAGVVTVSQQAAVQVNRIAGQQRARVQIPQYKDGLKRLFRARNTAPRQLLYVGRIGESKGVFLLLEAFARLAERHPGLELTFLGAGHDLDRLRTGVAALPATVRGRVQVPGATDGAGVFAALEQSDLLICPTTGHFAEGLAKTPIEAALCGVPAVVSTSVPVAELLGDAVQVVPADDTDALAKAIEELLADPARFARMATATQAQSVVFFERDRSLAAALLPAFEPSCAAEATSGYPDNPVRAQNPAM